MDELLALLSLSDTGWGDEIASGVGVTISLALATSFTAYGYLRKVAAVDGRIGLFWETSFNLPIAIVGLTILQLNGLGHFQESPAQALMLMAAGLVTVVPLLVETFGGCAPPLMSALQRAADWRQNKLTLSEYDETTWSARTWLSFVSQRLSVATQLAAAQEVAEALGLSVAADPRLQ